MTIYNEYVRVANENIDRAIEVAPESGPNALYLLNLAQVQATLALADAVNRLVPVSLSGGPR